MGLLSLGLVYKHSDAHRPIVPKRRLVLSECEIVETWRYTAVSPSSACRLCIVHVACECKFSPALPVLCEFHRRCWAAFLKPRLSGHVRKADKECLRLAVCGAVPPAIQEKRRREQRPRVPSCVRP